MVLLCDSDAWSKQMALWIWPECEEAVAAGNLLNLAVMVVYVYKGED